MPLRVIYALLVGKRSPGNKADRRSSQNDDNYVTHWNSVSNYPISEVSSVFSVEGAQSRHGSVSTQERMMKKNTWRTSLPIASLVRTNFACHTVFPHNLATEESRLHRFTGDVSCNVCGGEDKMVRVTG